MQCGVLARMRSQEPCSPTPPPTATSWKACKDTRVRMRRRTFNLVTLQCSTYTHTHTHTHTVACLHVILYERLLKEGGGHLKFCDSIHYETGSEMNPL